MADEKNTPSTPPEPKPAAPKAPVASAAPKPAPKAAENAPAAEKSAAKSDTEEILISPERPAVVDMRFVVETIASGPEVVLNTILKGVKRVFS
ncbi:MAG: hypothetical protein HGB19_05915 [Chlorobiales bacterium]|nr:hypothetical protein [Chlorobiales bacterium]